MIIIFIILISIVLIYIWKMWGVGNSVDVLYIKNFLPKDEHDKIKTECSRYNSSLEDDDLSIVKNRKMYKLQGDAYISKLFKSGRVRHRLKDLKVFPNNTPVEYRVYERGGAMDWHYDDQMYLIPQYREAKNQPRKPFQLIEGVVSMEQKRQQRRLDLKQSHKTRAFYWE